jgi:hypothetical protein
MIKRKFEKCAWTFGRMIIGFYLNSCVDSQGFFEGPMNTI